MLVLTRRLDQSLMIGDPGNPETVVEVVVAEVRGDQVRLGFKAPGDVVIFKAPGDVVIDRKEIWLVKQAEKAAGTRER